MRQNINVKLQLGRPLIGVLIALMIIAGLWPKHTLAESLVRAVGPIEITVSDMERTFSSVTCSRSCSRAVHPRIQPGRRVSV